MLNTHVSWVACRTQLLHRDVDPSRERAIGSMQSLDTSLTDTEAPPAHSGRPTAWKDTVEHSIEPGFYPSPFLAEVDGFSLSASGP